MIELSRTQDEEVGDGTTSVIVLGKASFRSLSYFRKLQIDIDRLTIIINLIFGLFSHLIPPHIAVLLIEICECICLF